MSHGCLHGLVYAGVLHAAIAQGCFLLIIVFFLLLTRLQIILRDNSG